PESVRKTNRAFNAPVNVQWGPALSPVEGACPEPVEGACPEPVEGACPEPVEGIREDWDGARNAVAKREEHVLECSLPLVRAWPLRVGTTRGPGKQPRTARDTRLTLSIAGAPAREPVILA